MPLTRRGSILEGTTVGDYDPVAVRQKRSVNLSVASIAWKDTVLNLIDTPGYADFTGELRAGLRGADAALFVVSSKDGVDASTARLWDECEAVSMPRAIVITNLDKDRADFDETVAVCQRVFSGGGGILPLFLPLHGDNGVVAGFVDLLDEQLWDWSTGDGLGARRRRRAPRPHRERAQRTDRGRHHRVRGRVADGPLHRWRGRSTSTCSPRTSSGRWPAPTSTR